VTPAVLPAPTEPAVVGPAPAAVQSAAVQLVLPLTVVLVGDASSTERLLREQHFRRPACSAQAEQLVINLQPQGHHLPGGSSDRPSRPGGRRYPSSPTSRPQRRRPIRPHVAADALALEHRDLAEKIAGNFARRTVHPKEDLLQLALIGLIKAARRYDPSRGPFRPYGRCYANGEITHFLRDNGFLVKVPPTWRETHARGQRLLNSGVGVPEMLSQLELSPNQWQIIIEACSIRVIAFESELCPASLVDY